MSLYYNLSYVNTTNKVQELNFSSNLSVPFILKPSDYDVSVIRFSLPNFSRPICTYTNDTTKYIMKMSYNGHSVQKHVVFISRTESLTDLYIWDIPQIIQMLNATIISLHASLDAIVTLPTSIKPYFFYNETTKLISYVALTANYETSLTTPITVCVDNNILNWIFSMPLYGENINSLGVPDFYKILVFDTKNISPTLTNYCIMTQNSVSFDRISDLDRIVLTTDLPIQNEYIGNISSMPIIQDYTPADLDITNYFNNIVYTSIYPYRMTRLLSDMPFNSIRFNCFTTSKSDSSELKPMYVAPNGSANIKLMFVKHERKIFA